LPMYHFISWQNYFYKQIKYNSDREISPFIV
jgi:hypothetical protein